MAGKSSTLLLNSTICSTKYYSYSLFTFPDQDEVLAPTGQIGAVEDCEMTGLEATIGRAKP